MHTINISLHKTLHSLLTNILSIIKLVHKSGRGEAYLLLQEEDTSAGFATEDQLIGIGTGGGACERMLEW